MDDVLFDFLSEAIKFGRIFTFVDFGNVNYWFRYDRKDAIGGLLLSEQMIIVDIKKLAQFIENFSKQKRFYYGLDIRQKATWHITKIAAENKFVVIKKPIQWVRRYLNENKNNMIKRTFIELPKCNFDVELTIDALRLINYYDTFVLFSSDSDFGVLLRYLHQQGKKVILFYSGHISHRLRSFADVLVNSQTIKKDIIKIKTKKNPTI